MIGNRQACSRAAARLGRVRVLRDRPGDDLVRTECEAVDDPAESAVGPDREGGRDIAAVDGDADVGDVDVVGHDDLDERVPTGDQVCAVGEDAQHELAVLRALGLRRAGGSEPCGLGRCDRVEVRLRRRGVLGGGLPAVVAVGGHRRQRKHYCEGGEDDE